MMKAGFSAGLALVAAGMMLGCSETPSDPVATADSEAVFKPGNKPGGGGGPGGGEGCQVEFDLDLVDGPVGSDLGGTYESGTQKVLVFTGSSGDGFRFDTNGSQQLEGRKDKRHIWLDFRGTAWTHLAGVGEDKGVDFRFAAGLDLCAMTIDESATVPVPVNLPFLSSFDGETIGLKYGGVTWSGNACNTPEASVTRTAQNQWQVSGGEACVVREGEILNPSPVVMPFSFTLTAQGTVP